MAEPVLVRSYVLFSVNERRVSDSWNLFLVRHFANVSSSQTAHRNLHQLALILRKHSSATHTPGVPLEKGPSQTVVREQDLSTTSAYARHEIILDGRTS
jgi:hypothetical protein